MPVHISWKIFMSQRNSSEMCKNNSCNLPMSCITNLMKLNYLLSFALKQLKLVSSLSLFIREKNDTLCSILYGLQLIPCPPSLWRPRIWKRSWSWLCLSVLSFIITETENHSCVRGCVSLLCKDEWTWLQTLYRNRLQKRNARGSRQDWFLQESRTGQTGNWTTACTSWYININRGFAWKLNTSPYFSFGFISTQILCLCCVSLPFLNWISFFFPYSNSGTFDVVVMVGGLQPDLVPRALRELCHVTKPATAITRLFVALLGHILFFLCSCSSYNPTDPWDFLWENLMWTLHQISTGVSINAKSPMSHFSFCTGGLICLTKTQHRTDSKDSTPAVERELQRLEKERVWTCIEIKKSDSYIKDTSMLDGEDVHEGFISGTVYLFRKPLIWPYIMWIIRKWQAQSCG